MTDAEWLTDSHPRQMLVHLRAQQFHLASRGRRKLRLFACACCRRIWRLLDQAGRDWVEWAEGLVDGKRVSPVRPHYGYRLDRMRLEARATQDPTELARRAADLTGGGISRVTRAYRAAAAAVAQEVLQLAQDRAASKRAEAAELAAQADLLRDIVDIPSQGDYAEPSWLAWNDGAVRSLAAAMYEHRDFGRMPILADALEKAGWRDPAILAHCREPGEHVRGCWVVDLLLGKT